MLESILVQLSNEPDSNKRIELMESWVEDNPNSLTREELEEEFYLYLEEVTRNKLIQIRNETKPFKAASLKTELISWLKLFVQDKDDLKRLIETYSCEINPVKAYTLSELRELAQAHEDQYLVQGLIRTSILLLLVAAPKTGKSLFITHLAVQVVRGLDFLNRQTKKSKVLYIQNEEHLANTYKRVYYNGLQYWEAQEPQLFQELYESNDLVVLKNVDIVTDKQFILNKLEELGSTVLIVDSLGASLRTSGLTEYSPELTGVLYDYQKIAHLNNITIIILHHATKMDSSESKSAMINSMGGTNGIGRANDGFLRLFAVKGQPSQVLLCTIPRDGKPQELLLELVEDEANYWTYAVKKETTLSTENIQLQNAILRLLYEQYLEWKEDPSAGEYVYGLTLTTLIDILGESRINIVKRLNDMCDTEGIERRIEKSKFVYSIPCNGESWLLSYLEAEDAEEQKKQQQNEMDMRMAEAVRNTTTKEEFVSLVKDWTDAEKKRIFALLDPTTMLQKRLLVNPPKYPVGSTVNIEGVTVTVAAVTIKDGQHCYSVRDSEGHVIHDYLEEQLS